MTITRRFRLSSSIALLFAAAALLAPAVSSGQSSPTSTTPTTVQAAPDAAAQMAEEVAREVEQLRGWTFKRPVRKLRATPEEARKYIERQLAQALTGDRQRISQAFLATAGLVPEGTDLSKALLKLLDEQVAGYYDPETSSLYLVERSQEMPALMQRVVLAHELTHALDDQYGDLRSLMTNAGERSEDAELVAASLGEGSATALMFQYIAMAQRAGKVNLAELGQYVAKEMERSRELASMPRYFSAMLGSYIVGAAFLAGGDMGSLVTSADNRAVGDRFLKARKNLPASSEQILHPEKYWNEAATDHPVLVDDRSIEQWLAAPGHAVVHRNTLGELLTAVLTQAPDAPGDMARMQSSEGWTNRGASGWGGDRFYLLAAGKTVEDATRDLARLRGVWVTTWDTAADRDEFVQALAKGSLTPRHVAMPLGRLAAVVFVGFEAAERQALMEKAGTTPLRFTKNGQPWKYE